jgi:hypothetical protein
VKAEVTKEIHTAVDTLTKEVVATIQKVIVPVKGQLRDVSDIVLGACAIAKMQGGSDKLKELCTKARDVFDGANDFLKDFEKKPQEMILALTTNIEKQLGDLVDENEKKMWAAAQTAVNDALKLPPAGSGSGSGSGSAGSGSAK